MEEISKDHYHNLGIEEINEGNTTESTAKPKECSGELALNTSAERRMTKGLGKTLGKKQDSRRQFIFSFSDPPGAGGDWRLPHPPRFLSE